MFNDNSLFERTSKGTKDMLDFSHSSLGRELWQLLAHINGNIPLHNLRQTLQDTNAVKAYGNLDNCLQLLIEGGLIAHIQNNTTEKEITLAPQESDDIFSTEIQSPNNNSNFFTDAVATISEIIEEDLGDESWAAILKIESCASLAELNGTIITIANTNKKLFSTLNKKRITQLVKSLSKAG